MGEIHYSHYVAVAIQNLEISLNISYVTLRVQDLKLPIFNFLRKMLSKTSSQVPLNNPT